MVFHELRSFEVPAALVAAGYGPTVDLDYLDREVSFPGPMGDWAEKLLFIENSKTLQDVCGDMRLLPRGILSSAQLDDGSLLIEGLVDSDGRVWDSPSNTWSTPPEDVNVVEGAIILDDDEIAVIARALREGANCVWFRPYIPKAFVSALIAAPPPPQDRLGKKAKAVDDPPTAQEIPAGSAIVAVVDPIDSDAVLEELVIAPGPRVLRRHNGEWLDDPEWIPVLKSVRPPKIVKLTEAQVASVTAQVDRSTADQDWEPFDADSREQYQIFTASAGSAYIQELQREADEVALFALVAVAGRELSPQDVASTERLKRYWTVGKGAAKIRWGTPGSWRRCYKHLVKYVGPKIAPGLCTNLGQRLGGPGVATHVTSSAEAVTAANPAGENGYDNGQTFKESVVRRDYHGQFTRSGRGGESGGGEDFSRSARAKRRRASMSKSRKAREDKGKKSSDAAANKAKREQEKAKRDAQRKQLAQLTLAISEASAAGNTVRAAELRVQAAQLRLSFADTETEKITAQASLNNARAALARARAALAKKNAAKKPKEKRYAPKESGWS